MLPLTKRQREILDYLNEFIQQHGYAPSLEEIGKKFGLSSLATVHKHLTNLQDKGLHQARLEPQPVGRDGPDAHGRPRGRAAAARLRRGRLADRGRRVERNDRGAGRLRRQARHVRPPRPRRLDDRRADPRRRLRRRRRPQDGRQRRDGHRAAPRVGRHAQEAATAIPAARSACSRRTPRCSRSSSSRKTSRSRASSSASCASTERFSFYVSRFSFAHMLWAWPISPSKSTSRSFPTTRPTRRGRTPTSARSRTRRSTSRSPSAR